MKKLFLSLLMLLCICTVKAQYVYKIKADSVKITNDSCTAELIIENSTKNVKGVLVNKGNGRTEFRRAEKLTDSSFVVAGDTIVISGTGKKPAGTEWTMRVATVDNWWQSVTYGNGLFVAVARGGTGGSRVMTSPDGINWTSRTPASDNSWYSVTYGNGLFVAVSDNGTENSIMTSPDGINWTLRTPPSDNNWFSVTYGKGLFVAVAVSGADNRVMTSPDGINWTSRTTPNQDWSSVTYGNGLFVAVALDGTGNRVMTSPDGINWTSRTSAADNTWYSITYGNGLFVAVALDGTGNRVMTSPDGINWTSRTSAADNSWFSVTYGDGLFVAVASSGTGNRVMTSPDGINWTSRSSAANNSWQGITYGNGMFVAVALVSAGTTDKVMTSGKTIYNAPSNNNIYQGGMNIYGNVGIGTTSPQATLHVTSSVNQVHQLIQLPATQTQATPISQIKNSSGDTLIEVRTMYDSAAGLGVGRSIYIGYKSGANNTPNISGTYNVALGDRALASVTTGRCLTAIGWKALSSATTPQFSCAIGQESLAQFITGDDNSAFGQRSLFALTSGNYNLGAGNNSGDGRTSGSFNTFIGTYSGIMTGGTGDNNTFLGFSAGRNTGTTAAGNICIGKEAGRNISMSNRLYIANSSTTSPLIYGEFDNNILATPGKFGIGTKTPEQSLHVVGQAKIDTITTGSGTDSILVVNNGVIKKILQSSISGSALSIGDAIGSGTSGSILYLNASGELEQNNNYFFIDPSTLQVGIGKNTPYAKLHVKETTPVILAEADDDNQSYLRLTESWGPEIYLGGYMEYDGSNNTFNIGTHNTEDTDPGNDIPAISIPRSGGKVGIRTKTPEQALHINGQAKIDTITNGTGTDSILVTNNGLVKKIAQSSIGGSSTFSTGTSGGQSVIGGTDSGDSLRLSSTADGSKGKILFGNSVYDEANNNLGIGTQNPAVKLDVKGNGYVVTLGGSGAATDYYSLQFRNDLNEPLHALEFGISGSDYPTAEYGATGEMGYMGTTGEYPFAFFTNNSVRLFVAGTGNVGIGVNTPSSRLHLPAGTATANTAPLKFSSGTNLTTPEDGSVEFDGTNYYATASTTRYTLAKTLTTTATLNFGSTAAGAKTDLTVTVTGAADGDVVSIGVPNGSTVANGSFTAWVSASNTVTVRFTNNDLTTSYDPASGTFRISVLKY